ncbi:dual specificity protein phosphatase 10 [Gadus chalcogrammus]|uniref:dual specificity protein phosphatase 10 n=1 Tax=Gadus chalcogrammus TaxID=1042646 RepID=UPI0024C48473|nr:dual specificity protein phosphatase 10 [Gadus chalcogrammus]XP_056436946.1 dual specificity protein phosphatase 10 [Gadus chalcogrammus]
MPPSPLDDRIVVALPRPVRPQELQLRLDASYLDAIAINSGGGSGSSSSSSSSSSSRRTSSTSISSISTSISSISSTSSGGGGGGKTIVSSTTLVQIRSTTDLVTYMPSSNGSTRSLSCGCSSASCCSVSTYERDARAHAHHGHHHAPSQVSASSPNLSYAGPSSPSPAPTALGSHGAGSTPSLSSTGPPRAQHSFRVIHPNELARRLACCPVGHPVAGPLPVIVDCRPFTEYNKGHVRGAVHINCSDKISRRRLQQGKVTVLELVSCREAKDSFRGGVFARDLVVYDDSTSDPARLAPSQPLSVVLESLRREGKDPIVLKGGLHAFRQCHEHLCDHSLRLHEGPNGGGGGGPGAAAALAGHAVGPLPSMPDIENAELTAILPLLYLGNERDARDLAMLRRANIGFVLNVTTHLPLFHYDTGLFCYKRLPATDSNKQNLRQYFEEAFEFIEEAHQAGMGLLIHCQAGVSRSATIVIAYLMKHTWMTMTDAYKFVKARRAIISPNLNFMGQLLEFEEDLNSGITPRILTPKLMGVETMV